MADIPPRLSLGELAKKLARDGPHKLERADRRVRGLLGGAWIFDSTDARFVWEHPYYPFFYIPLVDIEAGPATIVKHPQDGFWLGTLTVAEASVEVAGFETGELDGLVKITWAGIDWYSEDDKLLGPHPKDPYKRVECLASSRAVVVEINGALVARSTNNVFLHETSLPTRHYISPTTVDWKLLRPSDTRTYCSYKGEAHYYNVRVGDEEIKDAVWFYPYPTAESAAIQNRLCFYESRVDVGE